MKKYSRLVRKIAQVLIAHDVRPYFRESFINPETEEYGSREINLADLVERALQGETIKKSELDRLVAELTLEKMASAILAEECEKRLTERNATVAKLLHKGINLAAELRDTRDRILSEREEGSYALHFRDSQIANLHKQVRTLQYDLDCTTLRNVNQSTMICELQEQIRSQSEPQGFWARLFGKLSGPQTPQDTI